MKFETKPRPITPSLASESELIQMVQEGTEGAFEELERRYRPRIVQQLQLLCKDQEDIKDVLQDVWMALFLKVRTFEGRSSLSTWIYRVTFNAYLMHKRKQKRERLFFVDDAIQDALLQSTHRARGMDSPHHHAYRAELRSRLRKALSELPASYRQVFLAIKAEELPLKEISKQMGISIPAVKSRQHRARRYLKSRLMAHAAA
ncbi:MAG: sigma-70 family RNA polymerase sigma factor [bacterium]